MRLRLLTLAFLGTSTLLAQQPLRTAAGTSTERTSVLGPSIDTGPNHHLTATFSARITEAQANTRGEAWFNFVADFTDPDTHQLQSITSTEDAYGESRLCSVADTASAHFSSRPASTSPTSSLSSLQQMTHHTASASSSTNISAASSPRPSAATTILSHCLHQPNR